VFFAPPRSFLPEPAPQPGERANLQNWGEREFFFDRIRTKEYKKECKKKKIKALF